MKWAFFASSFLAVVGSGLTVVIGVSFFGWPGFSNGSFDPSYFEAFLGSATVAFLGLSGIYGVKRSLRTQAAFYDEHAIALNHPTGLGIDQAHSLIQLANIHKLQIANENLVEIYYVGAGYSDAGEFVESGVEQSVTLDGNADDIREFLETLTARGVPRV